MKIHYTQGKARNHASRILMSAATGCVLGATTALLLAPKSGRRLREDIVDAYEDLSDRGKDFFNDALYKAKSAGDFAGNMKEAARGLLRRAPEATNPQVNLLIGALAGGCLGAATIYALAKRREMGNFTERVRSAGRKIGSVKWMDAAKDILETVQKNINGSEMEEGMHEPNKLQDALKFANIGLRLWENINKRR